jgi:hypothetical protein
VKNAVNYVTLISVYIFFTALRSVIPYLQCTPPPPLLFDLFPKPCRTPIDCFPNLCCQEQGKRICRPPRRSLLALIAMVTQVIQTRLKPFGKPQKIALLKISLIIVKTPQFLEEAKLN